MMLPRDMRPLNVINEIKHGVFVEVIDGQGVQYNQNLCWEPAMRRQPQDYHAHRLVIDLDVPAGTKVNMRVYLPMRI